MISVPPGAVYDLLPNYSILIAQRVLNASLSFEHHYSRFVPQHPSLLVLPPPFKENTFLGLFLYWFAPTQPFF